MWSDLLGFGSAFEKGKWTFESQDALRNVSRLQLLRNSFYRSNSSFSEITFVLNDGQARVFDFPKSEHIAFELLWWLNCSIANHWIVNAHDLANGYNGMRSVMCTGERVQICRENITFEELVLKNKNFKSAADKKIIIYSPAEFQLNLALSKAYILESLGSRHGLTGPCLFIDDNVLDVIENYLTSGNYNLLEIHKDAEVTEFTDNSESTTLLIPQDNFRIERQFHNGIFRFEIFRELSDKEILDKELSEREIQVMAIELDKEPIIVSHRGINASLWRIKRFNPIDEEVPFYFDFENYSPDTTNDLVIKLE